MAIGPFTTYAPPGVYTRTIVEPVVGQILAGLRIPVIIGVGQESLTQSNFEMIRGSSSTADTPIFGEDAAGRWIVSGTNDNPTLGNQNGNLFKFRVRNFPIVDGLGIGKTTFDPSRVSVLINGVQTVVASVDGTNGVIGLLLPPTVTDVVSVNYYFHRRDTLITDTLTTQVTAGSAVLVAGLPETYTVVAGTNDTLKVYVNDATVASTITLTAGVQTAAAIANDVNVAAISGLTASVHVDNQNLNRVQLIALGNVQIADGNANGLLGYAPGQYTNRNKNFRTFNGPIVDGSDGGITTTDPSKVVVKVNGTQVIPSAVDGQNQTVTLAAAPFASQTVTIQYYFNTFQDTFDFLPNSNVLTVGDVGIAPGTRDYINGADFVIINQGDQSIIQWGTAFFVSSLLQTGSVPLNGNQIIGQLVDERLFSVECTRYVDTTTNSVSTTRWVMPETPTTGNGVDTPLGISLYQTVTNGRIDLPTNRPDLVIVRIGKTLRDALSRPAVAVIAVDSATNSFTTKDPVPADLKAYATFWYNRIEDETYTFRVTIPGASGVGQYEISKNSNGAKLYSIKYGSKAGLPQTVQWPSGVENITDAIHSGIGTPVSETVTVTFTADPATHASFSNDNPEPYDIYAPVAAFGSVNIDALGIFTVPLGTAFQAFLLGQPTTSVIAPLATDKVVLVIDGITITVDISLAVTVAGAAAAINAAVDLDVQVHADGSPTFLATAPNALASVLAYGTESVLVVRGRNVPSVTNGLLSSVRVIPPVLAGDTDGSTLLGLALNLTANGRYNALNQPAQLIGTSVGPYLIQAGIDDLLDYNIDGLDYSTTFPAASAVPVSTVVTYINNTVASAAVTAAALATLVTLTNEIRSAPAPLTPDYNAHIGDFPVPGIHPFPDAVNISLIGPPVAVTLADCITILNDVRALYNAHIADVGGPFHLAPDLVNTVTAPVATDLPSAIVLANDIKAKYNAHIISVVFHILADVVNTVTSADASIAGPASVGQGINLDKLVLTSPINTVASSVTIQSTSSSLTVLGFISGQTANRTQPTAANIANALNANVVFGARGVAYSMNVAGLGNFLRIDSLTAGVGSIINFTAVASTVFITDTGIGIAPGDGDIGEASQSGFDVTSSAGLIGSSGSGFPGQTYTDARTGLRFSVLASTAGDYTVGGSFTILVNSVFTCDASIPHKAIPGLNTTVFNTVGTALDTTALLQTFPRTGNEPAIGDVYYVSYQFQKTDLSTQLFRDFKQIQANFGEPVPANPLALGARLAILNGTIIVALKQVLRAANSSQASLTDFVAAINEQRKALPGNIKQDVIIPLGTDPQIFAAVLQHCSFMSAPRQEGERIGVVGVAAGTTPLGVSAIAKGINSERMVIVYPDLYVVGVSDLQGNEIDQVVDGSFAAAALGGSSCSPSIDVATPWTRRQIFGFKRVGRILDPTEANSVAVSGVSILEPFDPVLRVRHGLTTKVDNVFTRTPSVTLTIDFVQQSARAVLDPFIGVKFTGAVPKAVENTMVGMFSRMIDREIVSKVGAISAVVDPDDPTVLRVSAIYVPVFPLEWIVVTFQVRIRI